MDFQAIMKLNSELVNFKNVKLFSLAGDKEIIVENTETKAKFLIPFEENENGFIFNCKDGKQVEKGIITESEEFKNNTKNLADGIKAIFSEDHEYAVAYVKEAISSLPFVESKDPVTPKSVVKSPKQNLQYFKNYQKVIDAMNEERASFLNSNTFFNESNELNSNQVFTSKIITMISESKEEMKEFLAKSRQFTNLKSEVVKLFNEEVAKDILDRVDFSEDFDIKAKASKILVQVKQNHKDLNIVDGTKNLISLFEGGLTPNKASEYVYNFTNGREEAPKFLKFRTGEFTVNDVISIHEEVEKAMASIGEINDEELMFISNQKVMLEYMIRTRKISDKLVKQIIEDFNSKFKQTEDAYAQSALGFKSSTEANGGLNTVVDKKGAIV